MKKQKGFYILIVMALLMVFLVITTMNGLLTSTWSEAHAQSVITTIPVGDSPRGVAVNPLTNRIYVVNNLSQDVSVISGDTNSVLTTVGVAYSAVNVAVDPQTNRIYVSNCQVPQWGACVINGVNNSVIDSLGVTVYRDIAVNPQTNRIYAHTLSGNDDRVTVIDGTDFSVIDNVLLGSSLYYEDVAIGVNPQTNRIYATYSGDNSLTVINGSTNAIVTTIPLGEETEDVVVNPDTNRVYAIYGNKIAVINGANNTIIDTVINLGNINDLAINPTLNHLYVSEYYKVHILDGTTNGLVTTLSGLDMIDDLVANSQTDRVYVTHSNDDYVSVIQDGEAPPSDTQTPQISPDPSSEPGYIPIVLNEFPPRPTATPTPPLSQVYVQNDTGGQLCYEVLNTGIGEKCFSSGKSFYGSFPAGTYSWKASARCGSASGTRTYSAGEYIHRFWCSVTSIQEGQP